MKIVVLSAGHTKYGGPHYTGASERDNKFDCLPEDARGIALYHCGMSCSTVLQNANSVTTLSAALPL